jgi:PAS domain S-box-containing protein
VASDGVDHRGADSVDFRILGELLPGLVYVWDLDGDVVQRSDGLVDVVGLRPDEVPGDSRWWWELVHPEDRTVSEGALAEAMARREPVFRAEYRVRHPDGHHVWISERARILYHDDGRPSRLVGLTVSIDEHRRVASDLVDSERTLQLALDAARAGTFDIPIAEPGPPVVTDGVRRLFGFTADERPMLEDFVGRIHADDRPGVASRIQHTIDNGVRLFVEYRLERPDGEEVWLESHAEAVTGADGRTERIVGILLDVTGRKRAEENLREREARFRALLTSVDQGYCLCEVIVDDEGRPVDYRFLELNPQFELMTGLTGAEGRTAYELVPDLEPHWLEAYARVGLHGETMRFEQGSAALGRWFDVFAAPIEPVGRFALVFRDITIRKEAEEALRESEERFRNMADNSPVMVWVTGADGRCTYLSKSWYSFTGQEPDAGLGFGWMDRSHPEDRQRVEEEFSVANARREPFWVEYRLLAADGEYRWVLDSAGPRLGVNDEFLGYIGSVVDITDRKRTEEALRRSEAAERLARERVELLARLMSELEALGGVRGRARRLVELLVPEVADHVVVEAPGLRSAVTAGVEPDEVDPSRRVELDLDLGGGTKGRLILARHGDAAPYTGDQANFLASIAERTGLLLGSARLQEEEHQVALRLQQALLPDELVQHSDVALGARYEAASEVLEVGGDWYETFVLPDGRIGVAVGDVVGHGLEAAATMGRLRAALVALTARADTPGQLLTELDHFARRPGGTPFATACCAVLDPETGDLQYASAGHPPMLVVSPDGATRWLEDGRSVPLAVGDAGDRPEASIRLEAGSLVLLYSDGLVERRRERFNRGLERLESLARDLRHMPVPVLCDRILAEMSAGSTYEDDVVILGLRFGPAGDDHLYRPLPARAGELAPLRAELRLWLEQRGVSAGPMGDVLIAVTEACANSIEHAYPPGEEGEVHVACSDTGEEIVVQVQDQGRWRPPAQHGRNRGRGTAMMRAVSQGFSRETGAGGTTVTFRIPWRVPQPACS